MYFKEIKRSFADVTITNDGINTVEFLEAVDGVTGLFDKLKSAAFSIVTSDLKQNQKKIDTQYQTDPVANSTLEKLVVHEKSLKKKTATEGLLWLNRGLEFTATALRRSVDSTEQEELTVSFTKAYDETLSKHHGRIVKIGVGMALKAAPYRENFYKELGGTFEEVKPEFETWLAALEAIVARLNKFYEEGKYLG